MLDDLKQLSAILGSHEMEKIGVIVEQLKPYFKEICDEVRAAKAIQAEAAINADRLLKKKELADRLQLSISTINKLQADGLPFLKCNNAVRFEYGKVLDWLRVGRKKERENKQLRVVA